MADEAPKSALELAMERLKKKDAEAGVVEHKLTEEQKAAIEQEYRRDLERLATDRDSKIRKIRREDESK